jgi:hypothetical protein
LLSNWIWSQDNIVFFSPFFNFCFILVEGFKSININVGDLVSLSLFDMSSVSHDANLNNANVLLWFYYKPYVVVWLNRWNVCLGHSLWDQFVIRQFLRTFFVFFRSKDQWWSSSRSRSWFYSLWFKVKKIINILIKWNK